MANSQNYNDVNSELEFWDYIETITEYFDDEKFKNDPYVKDGMSVYVYVPWLCDQLIKNLQNIRGAEQNLKNDKQDNELIKKVIIEFYTGLMTLELKNLFLLSDTLCCKEYENETQKKQAIQEFKNNQDRYRGPDFQSNWSKCSDNLRKITNVRMRQRDGKKTNWKDFYEANNDVQYIENKKYFNTHHFGCDYCNVTYTGKNNDNNLALTDCLYNILSSSCAYTSNIKEYLEKTYINKKINNIEPIFINNTKNPDEQAKAEAELLELFGEKIKPLEGKKQPKKTTKKNTNTTTTIHKNEDNHKHEDGEIYKSEHVFDYSYNSYNSYNDYVPPSNYSGGTFNKKDKHQHKEEPKKIVDQLINEIRNRKDNKQSGFLKGSSNTYTTVFNNITKSPIVISTETLKHRTIAQVLDGIENRRRIIEQSNIKTKPKFIKDGIDVECKDHQNRSFNLNLLKMISECYPDLQPVFCLKRKTGFGEYIYMIDHYIGENKNKFNPTGDFGKPANYPINISDEQIKSFYPKNLKNNNHFLKQDIGATSSYQK